MHLKRRFISLLMASLLAATLSPMAHGYTDTENSWAAPIIARAGTYGLMEGFPDGRFGVGENMTRAAFATVLCRMFGWEPVSTPGESLSDVNSHWAKGYIYAVAAHGVVDSTGDFRPDDPISRLEIARMLVYALGYRELSRSLEDAPLPFADVTEDRGVVAIAYDLGIINGVEELGQLRFLPDFSAPREQCAAMLVRCYERYASSTYWLHGFYAFSSYPQINRAASMDGVSVGWAQFQFIDGVPVINDAPDNGNDWVKPEAHASATEFFARHDLPCNLNVFATAGAFNAAVDANAQSELINRLVLACLPYAGLTIDFEGLRSDSRDSYTAFISALRAALPEKKSLYVCVQPDTWYGGYDYRSLGEICDKVILMAHDYQWTEVPSYFLGTSNTYSPVTPLPQIYTALKHVTDAETGVQDRNKLALQISFGTAGFQVDENGLLQSATIYHPAKDTIAMRLGQKDTHRTWDEVSCDPYIEYTVDDGRHYKLWYEDEQSVAAKLQLARMFGVNGVSVWRLGTIPDYPELPYYDVASYFAQR